MYHSVGMGPGMDHNYWGLPENQNSAPQSKGGPDRPVTAEIGSNVAGSFAAGLALFSKAWEKHDPSYSEQMLRASVDIYDNIVMKKLGTTTEMPCCYVGGGRTDDDEAMAALALWYATGENRFGYDLLENKSINDNSTADYSKNVFSAGHLGLPMDSIREAGPAISNISSPFPSTAWPN